MNPRQIEDLLTTHFSTLFEINKSIEIKDNNLPFRCFQSAFTDKGRALLIEQNSSKSNYIRPESMPPRVYPGKIRIEEVSLEIDGDERLFMAVYCRKRSLIYLFNRLLADLIWHLVNEGVGLTDPWEYIVDRIDGWRLLFSGYDKKAEEKGLIGEMITLKYLLERKNVNINVWAGPLDGTKDFRLPNQNIEVKTTSVRTGYYVEINGLFQVLAQNIFERLVFIRLEETPNGNISLNNLRNELFLLIEDDLQRLEFDRRLEEFSSELFDSSNKWNLLEAIVMEVDDKFPKISENIFIGQRLPEGVVKITWTADLAGLEKKNLMDFQF